MHSSTEPSVAAPSLAAGDSALSETTGAAPLGRQARIAVAVLALCALAALFWPHGKGTFQEPGGFLFDGEGKATTLGPRLAPVTLVHFWATWCPPCRDEIPSLQRLGRDFSRYNDFGIAMIAVADNTEKAKLFVGDWGSMVLYDPSWDVAKRYGTDKLPETYLVVRGQVVQKFVGQTDWDSPELRQLIQKQLGPAAGSPRASGT